MTSLSLSKKISKIVLLPTYYNPKSYRYKKFELAITNNATNKNSKDNTITLIFRD